MRYILAFLFVLSTACPGLAEDAFVFVDAYFSVPAVKKVVPRCCQKLNGDLSANYESLVTDPDIPGNTIVHVRFAKTDSDAIKLNPYFLGFTREDVFKVRAKLVGTTMVDDGEGGQFEVDNFPKHGWAGGAVPGSPFSGGSEKEEK
ncbi:MAG: hypothetical protein SVS15_04110 [Thermodesulfobacteriota bacterium]|nr:hypothetical protein [Thermodesulfobacteriota bacterium]